MTASLRAAAITAALAGTLALPPPVEAGDGRRDGRSRSYGQGRRYDRDHDRGYSRRSSRGYGYRYGRSYRPIVVAPAYRYYSAPFYDPYYYAPPPYYSRYDYGYAPYRPAYRYRSRHFHGRIVCHLPHVSIGIGW